MRDPRIGLQQCSVVLKTNPSYLKYGKTYSLKRWFPSSQLLFPSQRPKSKKHLILRSQPPKLSTRGYVLKFLLLKKQQRRDTTVEEKAEFSETWNSTNDTRTQRMLVTTCILNEEVSSSEEQLKQLGNLVFFTDVVFSTPLSRSRSVNRVRRTSDERTRVLRTRPVGQRRLFSGKRKHDLERAKRVWRCAVLKSSVIHSN